MPDAALSVASSPIAALLSGAPSDSGAKTHATAQGTDPFAALLAGASGAKDTNPGKTSTADAVAALLANTAPVAATPAAAATPAPDLPVATDALPVDPDTALAAPKGKSDDADDGSDDGDDKGDKDDGTDALANAIASGATAVLALAPVIVAPIQSQPPAQTPVRIDAPLATRPPKLIPVTAPSLNPRFKAADTQADQAAAAQYQLGSDNMQADARAPQQQAPATEANAATAQLPPDIAKAVAAALNQGDDATTAAKAPLGSDTAQADAHAQQQQQATEAKPATAQLPPDIAKAVAAALNRGDDASTAATAAAADPTTTPAAIAAAKAQLKQQPQQPQQPGVQRQDTPAQPQVQTARRRSDEVSTPPRASDTRKRTDPTPTDAVSAGLTQRATDTARVPAGLAASDVHAKGDAIVQQTLSIARDGAWLDTLAHDIASAGSGGDLQFKLEPQNLGSLSVAISQSADGASIRLTADNETTRDILVDAQPKLVAEAHAQGLKISDTQVDVRQDQNRSQNQSSNQDAQRWAQNGTGQNGTSQNGQNRQSSPDHQPFVSNLRRKAEAESESPDSDSGALYA
jgi:flagellar hook-length control protein FliK